MNSSVDTPAGISSGATEIGEALSGAARCGSSMKKHAQFLRGVHAALATDKVSLPQLAWSMSIILSRALSGAHFPYSLVPVFDFLNHSLHPTALHRFDADRQLFEVVATTDHADGDEVFISYGCLPNDRLLHLYGFALGNNPHNRAVLQPACGPVPPAMTPLQSAVAEARRLDPLASLSLSTHSLTTMLPLARTIHLTPADLPASLVDRPSQVNIMQHTTGSGPWVEVP